MDIEWRVVEGTNGLYEVSNTGEVRRRRWRWTVNPAIPTRQERLEVEPRPVRISRTGQGYGRVTFSVNGITQRRGLAEVVGSAFLPPLASDRESYVLRDGTRRDDYSVANIARRGADGALR